MNDQNDFITSIRSDGYYDLYIPRKNLHIIYNSDKVIINLEQVMSALDLSSADIIPGNRYTLSDVINLCVDSNIIEKYTAERLLAEGQYVNPTVLESVQNVTISDSTRDAINIASAITTNVGVWDSLSYIPFISSSVKPNFCN